MKVTLSDQDGFCHVMVQGNRLKAAEEKQLLAVLQQPHALPLRLYFYELQWISPSLIHGLHQALGRDTRNEAHFFNRHLFSYLLGLGMSVRLMPTRGGGEVRGKAVSCLGNGRVRRQPGEDDSFNPVFASW